MRWIDFYGNRFTDEQIFERVLKAKTDGEYEHKIHVGTDSNANGRQYKFVSVLAIHKVGHGADYYYLASFEPRATYRGKNHKMRLFQEVVKSVETADILRDNLGIVVDSIHVDASPKDLNEFSSEFSEQLKGYVIANGYECVLKPNSWAATAVADKHSK